LSTYPRHGNTVGWPDRLDKETRDMLAPVLATDPGPLTPRQARLRRWLELYDTDRFVAPALGDALSNEKPVPADPAHAELWAAVRVLHRLTPEQRAECVAGLKASLDAEGAAG
jgi:hypothetical protein